MQSGTVLADRYRLEEKLGIGGMGEVWRAVDGKLDRQVAIKILFGGGSDDPAMMTRFNAEVRIAARVRHDRIVVLFDAGEHEGRMFLVMEYLDGDDLARVLLNRRGGLPIEEAVLITERVADALDAAHRHNVVHRDVKPGNIVLLRDGFGVPKLCDFGIARIIERSGLVVTRGVGTAYYMAPEQFSGRVDARSDLYSLGCVLYEMVTGQRPFLGDAAFLMAQHLNATPERPSEIRPDIPLAVEELILHLMAKDPGDRPQTAEQVAERLRNFRRGVRAEERRPTTTDSNTWQQETEPPPASPVESKFIDILGLHDALDESGDRRLPLGVDDGGVPVFLDLTRSTHLLIGGSHGDPRTDPVRGIVTGALLYTRPSRLRLAFVDSRAGRLADFAEAPHVLPMRDNDVLPWVVEEVGRRFAELRATKCRTIDDFNERAVTGQISWSGKNSLSDELPYPDVLTVIDEFAEPMSASGGEIGSRIAKIAQVSRAVGVHLVVRTTRPSAKVLTSSVSAYFPGRLCLPVSSVERSRCVLDEDGAETLMAGRALFRPTGGAAMIPLRPMSVSDDLVQDLVHDWPR
ncbi:protein kinase domain-containing protein [Herbidospora yilanensis]|uniref:protein kinase domain-containing protein n=1 Tax=Herbidospora yilanensis TaxID=354426 RepID=UPI0007828C0D|nr:protein kinase [Herbidospora yilanensis]